MVQGTISPADLTDLPLLNTVTIPEDYLDEMGHMNIMYYIHIFDRAAWELFTDLGLSLEYLEAHNAGMFALKQFIQYWAEVHVEETVSVYGRVLGVSERRVHFMMFMVNNTQDRIAATFEVLGSYADLTTRRTAPLPDDMRQHIQERIDTWNQLGWDAPTCGILQA